MISVDVDLGGDYPVKAMVDTGCAMPMYQIIDQSIGEADDLAQ
jgi:hypothetical protein